MVDLYLAGAAAGEADRAALQVALSGVPSMFPCTWVERLEDAHLIVDLHESAASAFRVPVVSDDLERWSRRGVQLQDPMVRFRWLAKAHGAIMRAVEAYVVHVPVPLQDLDLVEHLVDVHVPMLVRALPDDPGARFAGAVIGAFAVVGQAARMGEVTATRLQSVWQLVEEPLWSASERAAVERAVWAALSGVADPVVRDGLAARPFLAQAQGRYAAGAEVVLPALRIPCAEWVVAADLDVSSFVTGALGHAFAGDR